MDQVWIFMLVTVFSAFSSTVNLGIRCQLQIEEGL